jgi:hypothetical protein
MNGYELYGHYNALKMHFTTDSYDFFKYNGKTRISVDSFERRKDKYFFHKLARKLKDDEAMPFMLANFLHNPKVWVKDLLEPEAMECYAKWRRTNESLTYTFDQDMERVMNNKQDKGIRSIFSEHDGPHTYPFLWQMMVQGDIHMETIVILHKLMGILSLWDPRYKRDYMYEKTSRLIRKYEPFLVVDNAKCKEIVQKHLTAG